MDSEISFGGPNYGSEIGFNNAPITVEFPVPPVLDQLLPTVPGAAFDSYGNQHEDTCLPGTRTEILHQIGEWASSPRGKCIFWLNGLAGTGKSTISRTMAESFSRSKSLGASFFFKRGEGDRGNARKLFPTIVRQLAISIPQLLPALRKALNDEPNIAAKSLKEQFKELLLQPLLSLETVPGQTLAKVIVIDALDECEGDEDIRVILQLLPQLLKLNTVRLRVFLTSRPEVPIRLGFSMIRSREHEDLVLHEIPESVTERDISLFLRCRLSTIRTERFLPIDWPAETDIQSLVRLSVPLFIVAATMCRIFEDPNWDPMDSVTDIIAHLNEGTELEGTYPPAFNQLLNQRIVTGMKQILDCDPEDNTMNSRSDQSDIESIFSVESLLSSQSSLGEVTSSAVSALAHLLLNDDELSLLYSTAISKIGSDRFQRNFARILKSYGQRLQGEATNEIQRQAAHFVRISAQQTAAHMRRVIWQDSSKLPVGQKAELDVSKAAQVDAWLESQKGQAENLSEADADELTSDSDSVELEAYTQPSLGNLEEVKEFMISTKAFFNLRRQFREWLNPNEKIEEETLEVKEDCSTSDPGTIQGRRRDRATKSWPLDVQAGDSTQLVKDGDNPAEEVSAEHTPTHKMTLLSLCWLWFMNFYSPPAAGYQRIPYTCGCGELLYIDVRELSAGGVERFRRRLLDSVAAVKARLNSQPSPNSLQTPPPVHFNPGLSSLLASRSAAQHSIPYYWPSQSSQFGNTRARSTISQTEDSQFLLLCINTKNSTVLVHVEVGSLTSDQCLFQQILQHYQSVRKEHEWRISMIIPFWFHNLLHAISTQLSRLPFLPSSFVFPLSLRPILRETRLHKIASGDFVRFQLVPVGMECIPRWFKTREMPPEAEVKARRYLYEPVPMDDVEFADIPLRHLLKPGPHTDRFWITTFPKKIRDPLVRLPGYDGQRVIGWGIRINESLNWVIILLSILIILLAIGVVVILYAAMTSDSSSAFGLGAFMVATFTAYLPYQYYAWKEDI